MLLRVLQDTTNAAPSFLRAASEQIPGVVVGIFLGFLSAVILHRWQTREAKAAIARDLTSYGRFALRRLNTRIEGLDEAREEDQAALITYFRLHRALWDGEDAALFRGAVQSATTLSLSSLNAWRECVVVLASAQTSHYRILSLIVLPDEPNLDARATTYRQALIEAKARLQIALRAIRRYGDKECRAAIDQLLQE